MFVVVDCLSGDEIAKSEDRREAESLKTIHGGADNCIHIFESEEKASKEGYLF